MKVKEKEITNAYGMYCCTGEFYATEREAWEAFDESLNNIMIWTRGYKYWRHTPVLTEDREFVDNGKAIEIKYGIRSRITLTDRKLKGIKQISLKEPYPKEQEKGFDRILDKTYEN